MHQMHHTYRIQNNNINKYKKKIPPRSIGNFLAFTIHRIYIHFDGATNKTTRRRRFMQVCDVRMCVVCASLTNWFTIFNVQNITSPYFILEFADSKPSVSPPTRCLCGPTFFYSISSASTSTQHKQQQQQKPSQTINLRGAASK